MGIPSNDQEAVCVLSVVEGLSCNSKALAEDSSGPNAARVERSVEKLKIGFTLEVTVCCFPTRSLYVSDAEQGMKSTSSDTASVVCSHLAFGKGEGAVAVSVIRPSVIAGLSHLEWIIVLLLCLTTLI